MEKERVQKFEFPRGAITYPAVLDFSEAAGRLQRLYSLEMPCAASTLWISPQSSVTGTAKDTKTVVNAAARQTQGPCIVQYSIILYVYCTYSEHVKLGPL